LLTFALVLVLAGMLALLAAVGFMASMATGLSALFFAAFVILFAAGLVLGLRRGPEPRRLPAGEGSRE